MFTGIIEEKGKVLKIRKGPQSSVITIEAHYIFDDLKIGDSVATNGVCLTVTEIMDNKMFSADIMSESLQRSTLGQIKPGDSVNLERALAVNGRFGGHMVSGHVDGIGTIIQMKKEGIAFWYTVQVPESLMKYIVMKGSIAVDGMSLTVAKLDKNQFSVSLIPHTYACTIFSEKSIGHKVNVETDILGKYMEKWMPEKTKLNATFLIENGF